MLNRNQVERILMQHGVTTAAPEEQIRGVLVSARWHDDDIASALYVLRENVDTHQTHIDSLHKVQRTDERLRPETIKALLGIDVDVEAFHQSHARRRRAQPSFRSQIFGIMVWSFVLAVVFVFYLMWVMQAGIFHPTVT